MGRDNPTTLGLALETFYPAAEEVSYRSHNIPLGMKTANKVIRQMIWC